MKARSHFLLAWILIACLTVKCVVGVPVPAPVPQDEGEEEEELGEVQESTGEGAASEGAAAAEGETVTSEDAAAAAIAPTGGIPQGLSNILESSGPGETVARADEAPAATESENLDGEVVETSKSSGEGEAAAAGGAAGLLASLQEGLKENGGHVAVGGIGVAAVACVVGFSSKIIGMLKEAQAQLPDVSTISDKLKTMDGLKPGEGGGPNNSSGTGGNNKGPDAKAKEAMENAKEKLKSKLPWSKGAAAGAGGGAAGSNANADGTDKGPGGKDIMSKKGVAENQAGPGAGLAKAKQFLSKKDDIRKALKSKAGALGKAAGKGGDKLSGIAEDDEPEEDLIGVKNVESNESAPGGAAANQAEQIAKIESLAENPEALKDLESLVQNPEELEHLREILQKPLQIEEIRKLVGKPEQLKLLESMLEDPTNLKKLEKSLEMSDKFEEMDTLLSKSKAAGLGALGGLEQRASSLYSASPTALFGQELRGDALDSGAGGGGRDGAGKSEAIRRLDEILAKYNDDGHYAEGGVGGGGAGLAGRRGDDYLYGSTSGGESPGDTLSRSMDYQRYGGAGEDSRGSTMTRSAISPYDTAYYDNSNQIRMVGESLDDIQRPAQFDTLSDEDGGAPPFEDPRAIADVARRQARVPSGISGRTVAKVGGGAVAGAGATAAVMAASRTRTASPTVGKVVPAQSAAAAARKLPQPTARTAASRAIASSYARPASPVTTGTGASRLSRPAAGHGPGPTRTVSSQVMSREREREAEEYGSNDDLRGRRVQFRPEYDDYLYQQQTL